MNLYEIDFKIRQLIDPETGVVGDYEELMRLYENRQEAIEQLALLIKEKTALMEAVIAEKKSLEVRRKDLEYMVERMTRTLEAALEGDTGFETAKVKVTTRRTTKVEVEDEEKVFKWLDTHYGEWKNSYTKPYVEKRELSKRGLGLLLIDNDIPGARRVSERSVSIK